MSVKKKIINEKSEIILINNEINKILSNYEDIIEKNQVEFKFPNEEVLL